MCGRGDTDTPRPTSAGGSNSSHPVRYFNGDIQLSVDDLASTAAGMSWGHHRTYSNRLSTDYDYGNGYNWVVAAWPYMLDQPGGTVVVVFDPRESYWFDLVDGLYVARHGQSQGLVYDTANSLFKLTFPDGRLFEFRDLASETSHAGRLSRVVAPSGAVTEVTAYTSAEQIAEVQRSSTSGSTLTVESYLYSYLTSGDLESVTLRRRVGSGDWENVARACYTYYASGDTHGSAADLKTAVHQLPDGSSWIDGDVYYYRYYLSGETGGLIHMLKYVVRPRAYAALAADSRVSDPLTASDAIVAEYADSYFEYNSSWRVTREVVEGGSREYLFSYTDGTHADGYSDWKRKTQETLPDGSRNVVYTNYRGQVLLKEFQPADGDSHVEFHQYDARGRLTLSADSSSIASYVDNAGTGANELAVTYRTESATRSLGLVKLYEYYATTDLEQGAVAGYPSYDKIQKGPDGTAIKLHKYEYASARSLWKSATARAPAVPAPPTPAHGARSIP